MEKCEPTSLVKMKQTKKKKTTQDAWQVMQSRTRLKFHLIVSPERLMKALACVCAGLHSQFESFMSYEGCAPVFFLSFFLCARAAFAAADHLLILWRLVWKCTPRM